MLDGPRSSLIDSSDASLVAGRSTLVRSLAPGLWRRLAGLSVEQFVCIGCLAGAAAALCVAAYALRNVYVGDAAVYLPYAQHAAHGHFFQFNLGQFSSGATSPLWGVLLAVPYVFGFSLAGAKAFALVAAVAALFALVAAAGRLTGSWAAAAVTGLFVVGATAWYALVLYESALVIGVVSVSLLITSHVLTNRGAGLQFRHLAPLIAIWALLPLTRPDATIVVGAEAVALIFFGPLAGRRAVRLILPALAVAAVPAALYYGYSLVHIGTFSTSASERTFALHEAAHRWVGPLYFSTDALRQLFATYWAVVTIPGLAGLGLLARNRPTRWIGVTGGLVFVAYLALLTFVSPGLFDTPRYLIPVTPFLAVGAARALGAFTSPRARWAALALGLAVIGGFSIRDLHHRAVWLRSLGLSSNEVFERDAVAPINAAAHTGDTLLAYEVQLRAYLRADVSVLSEDGITDAAVRPYQTPAGMTRFLRRYRPAWWIADGNVATRKYMQGSVLDRVFTAFRMEPAVTHQTVDGIDFKLVARRSRPLAAGFGGWQMLFRLSYPG